MKKGTEARAQRALGLAGERGMGEEGLLGAEPPDTPPASSPLVSHSVAPRRFPALGNASSLLPYSPT